MMLYLHISWMINVLLGFILGFFIGCVAIYLKYLDELEQAKGGIKNEIN